MSCLMLGLSGQSGGESDSIEKDFAFPGGPSDGGAAGWLLDVDSNSFSFAGTVICGGADIASGTPYGASGGWAFGVGNEFAVGASGTFNNLICMTGTANGTAHLAGNTNLIRGGGGQGTRIDFEVGITLADGVGAVSLVVDPYASHFSSNIVTGGNGGGVINVVPTSGSCLTGEFGVTNFFADGAFATSISGDGGLGG